MVDKSNNKSFVSRLLGVDRSTVIRWARRRVQLKNRSRKPKKNSLKITEKIEVSIVNLRVMFKWGSGRIRQHLIKAPAYLREVLPDLVQNVDLSRPAIKVMYSRNIS